MVEGTLITCVCIVRRGSVIAYHDRVGPVFVDDEAHEFSREERAPSRHERGDNSSWPFHDTVLCAHPMVCPSVCQADVASGTRQATPRRDGRLTQLLITEILFVVIHNGKDSVHVHAKLIVMLANVVGFCVPVTVSKEVEKLKKVKVGKLHTPSTAIPRG